tara:strand:+ start:1795 stop:1989 length:195 start_codon:yes stop_codon:yes gene_type:complete
MRVFLESQASPKTYKTLIKLKKLITFMLDLARKMRMNVIILSHLYKLHINTQRNSSTTCYFYVL